MQVSSSTPLDDGYRKLLFGHETAAVGTERAKVNPSVVA
jgi:hypothetical protein